jgi:hypothetical protein
MAMKEKVRRRHKQAESNRDLGKFLRYALGRTVNRSKPPVLVETTPEGTRVWGGKKRVKAVKKKHTNLVQRNTLERDANTGTCG